MAVNGIGPHRIWYTGGRYAYASIHFADFTDHILAIIDMSDPRRPEVVGRWWLPGMWRGGSETPAWPSGKRCALHHALVAGHLAYGAWRDGGLTVLDVAEVLASELGVEIEPEVVEKEVEKQVAEFRAAREAALRDDPESMPPEKRDKLLPLQYYPPDEKYSVPAALRLSDERPIVEVIECLVVTALAVAVGLAAAGAPPRVDALGPADQDHRMVPAGDAGGEPVHEHLRGVAADRRGDRRARRHTDAPGEQRARIRVLPAEHVDDRDGVDRRQE